MGLAVVRGVGGDVGEIGGFDAAAAAAFHLVVEEGRADIAEEDEAFEGLDVDAGGDHVDGDGDAELGLGAEVLDEVLGFDGAGGGLVGDLAAEGVAFVEDVAADADDAVGVGVGLGEDEGLGHPRPSHVLLVCDFRTAGEEGVVEVVAVGFEDGPYLVVGDDGAAEFVGAVFEVVFDRVGFPDVAVAVEELELGPGGQAGAFGADAGGDAVGDVVDVDFIEDGLPVGVAADGVLVEEGFGIEGGCGGEADDEGVEVVEDLLPFVVDGAVAFIDDDEVESLGGKVGLVGDFDGVAGGEVAVEGGELVLVVVDGFGVAFELGEEALDGGDDDLVDGIEAGGAEVADVVDFGEELACVGGGVGVELALGLGAEGVAVDEEEDAFEAGELEEAVDFGDGGEGLAGAGGHVDEGAGTGGGEGGFEAGDGFALAFPEGLCGAGHEGVERVRGEEGGEAAAEGVVGGLGAGEEFLEVLWRRKMEDRPCAGLGVAGVGELDLAAVGFEAEGQAGSASRWSGSVPACGRRRRWRIVPGPLRGSGRSVWLRRCRRLCRRGRGRSRRGRCRQWTRRGRWVGCRWKLQGALLASRQRSVGDQFPHGLALPGFDLSFLG